MWQKPAEGNTSARPLRGTKPLICWLHTKTKNKNPSALLIRQGESRKQRTSLEMVALKPAPLPHPETLFKPAEEKTNKVADPTPREPTPQERIHALKKKREAAEQLKSTIAAAGLTVEEVLASLQ